MNAPVRIAVVNSHPIQYFAPLYAYLNRDPALEVTALYCSDSSLRDGVDPGFRRPITWDIDLLDGYPYVFVGRRNWQRFPQGFWSLTCPRIWSEIRSGKYDAVWLHGYNYAACLIAFAAARSKRLPVLMRSETHLSLHRRAWRQRVRDGLLSLAYRFVDGFLAIGSGNRRYYRTLGIPEDKIFDVPYTVDNERFVRAADASLAAREAIRRRYGLSPHEPVVLYASKFLRRKHPDNVVRAVAALQAAGRALSLLLIGSGEMESELHGLAASCRPGSVVFGGFVNQQELPAVYAACDIFVLTAEDEPWGLAVNEVMCAALPVVVSNEMGCAADLVKDGVNGYSVAHDDMAAMVRAIDALLVDEAARKQMGMASRSIIGRWGYEQCRKGLVAALSRIEGAAA